MIPGSDIIDQLTVADQRLHRQAGRVAPGFGIAYSRDVHGKKSAVTCSRHL